MAEIKGGNLKSRLKKVTTAPRPVFNKPEESNEIEGKYQKPKEESGERENLTLEVIGYMQTPNGSLDDLLEKAIKETNVSRGFIYTLVRREWVKGFRVVEEGQVDVQDSEPCTVYPGREYSSTLVLPDSTQALLADLYTDVEALVSQAHMYRFDKASQKHVIDKIAFYKHRRWPGDGAYKLFSEPEPPQDSSLENRNRWEKWNQAKLAEQQSDGAQLHLVSTKLVQLDAIVQAVYQQLEATISQMREMSDAVMGAFEEIPLERLRTFVASIPGQIKKVTHDLQKSRYVHSIFLFLTFVCVCQWDRDQRGQSQADANIS